MTEIAMPRLADGMDQGTIVAWLVEPGTKVAIGDEIVEIETDKAAMAYASHAEGYLEILAEPGSTLLVGAIIARLTDAALASGDGERASSGESSDGVAREPAHTETSPQVAESSPAEPVPAVGGGDRVGATPLARRMAARHDIDLAAVTGTGPRNRIMQADVAALVGLDTPTRTPHLPEGPAASVTGVARGSQNAKAAATRHALTRLQQTIARRMAESKGTIPHFQVQADLEADAMLGLRAQLKHEKTLDPIPSVNDLIVKASALALREFPLANGAFRDGEFEVYEQINIGVAVAAEAGLVVPVIANADNRSIGEIARESRRLAGRVRDGSVTPPELAGGTFTVSNLGMFGMSAIFPVINPGQAAILGVGASRGVPSILDGELCERQAITLTLSCDHRILYGAQAATFLSRIVEILARPLQLLL